MEKGQNGKPVSTSVGGPHSVSSEDDAAFIAKIKAECDPVAAEAQWQEAIEQWKNGELVSIEHLLRELGIQGTDEKEPA